MSRRKETTSIVEIREMLERNNTHIKEAFHVREIGIFGSFISGKQKAKSDVDILVAFKKGHKDFFNYMRLKYCIEDILGRKVDLVMKEALKPRIRQKILNEVEYV
ncbi:nucleotidyltransferase family protein [Thermodesulfovibrionales bacterium]|nr:nucleotidyltransferase family protein [Thermodesulfovibrionales bacterium]MCL0067281.1 nucleotidyltransferase family protein [Thermodesulfovibrionales bacterium]MCL0083557.1 nucleotidyltransferase family protein [Thermodesulfovibrionales bacterium]